MWVLGTELGSCARATPEAFLQPITESWSYFHSGAHFLYPETVNETRVVGWVNESVDKCLLPKQGDLSSDPQKPYKSQAERHILIIPTLGGRDRVILGFAG